MKKKPPEFSIMVNLRRAMRKLLKGEEPEKGDIDYLEIYREGKIIRIERKKEKENDS